MSTIHDLIKIKYANEGYLPNYPYHLISDEEMCDAFYNDSDTCYYKVTYPCVDPHIKNEYDALTKEILKYVKVIKESEDESGVAPDWVYTYMLGTTVSVNSDVLDRHDLLVLMSVDNLDDVFDVEATNMCLKISRRWLVNYSDSSEKNRPPTMFGEPHVFKSLRLEEVSPIAIPTD